MYFSLDFFNVELELKSQILITGIGRDPSFWLMYLRQSGKGQEQGHLHLDLIEEFLKLTWSSLLVGQQGDATDMSHRGLVPTLYESVEDFKAVLHVTDSRWAGI